MRTMYSVICVMINEIRGSAIYFLSCLHFVFTNKMARPVGPDSPPIFAALQWSSSNSTLFAHPSSTLDDACYKYKFLALVLQQVLLYFNKCEVSSLKKSATTLAGGNEVLPNYISAY